MAIFCQSNCPIIMASTQLLSGVLAPVITPFDERLEPDAARLIGHCRWLQSRNCGLAVFGTNSEANSLSVTERMRLLDALVAAGLDPRRMLPGTGTCALPDTVALTRHAIGHGVGGVLMLPPFYYKDVSDEGVYRSYAEVIERVGDDRLRIYLYHFPQMSGVPLGVELVRRLREDFPGIVVGMKDSSGEQANLERMLAAFPGFAMFAGTEMLLLANMRYGGAGCISATANINPAAIDRLFRAWEAADADAAQEKLDAVRMAVQQFPLVAALKTTIAHYSGDPGWNRLRPPLVELDGAEADRLISRLEALGFTMPGL
jgi:4-hydroxy-tetrahydrodipicolinate synthase